LLDEIDHGQQALPVATQKLGQSSGVRFSFGGEGVIASSQGGSPFAQKVFQPDSTKSRVENRPSTCNYAWDTVQAGASSYMALFLSHTARSKLGYDVAITPINPATAEKAMQT
jgi:hypothetical protein